MDRASYISAYDLVNNLTRDELSLIIKNFGQEHWHNRIAERLVYTRNKNPITTTTQLSKIILEAMPYHRSYWRIHPATRTFQALRIAVNRELEALSEGLDKAINLIGVKGRIVVISFHSLEDRIVKNIFRNFAHADKLKIITKKPLEADKEEITQNPRSRSACLRVAEVIR
jgi:16S rRNA (cytosine1402-N4)-methyltransferase